MRVREITLRMVVYGDTVEAHDVAESIAGFDESVLCGFVVGERERDATPAEEKLVGEYRLEDGEDDE